MSGPPPEENCNLACQTKIVINGGTASRILESTCEGLQHFFNNGGKLQHSDSIIALLNEIEDKAIALQKLVLKAGMGYSGPTGKLLE